MATTKPTNSPTVTKAVGEVPTMEAAALREPATQEAPLAAATSDDSQFVPVLTDENGERIPRNSVMRVYTTVKGNLRSLDGLTITPAPIAELHGPDIRNGDWYCSQFQAGLIKVDSVKKIR